MKVYRMFTVIETWLLWFWSEFSLFQWHELMSDGLMAYMIWLIDRAELFIVLLTMGNFIQRTASSVTDSTIASNEVNAQLKSKEKIYKVHISSLYEFIFSVVCQSLTDCTI